MSGFECNSGYHKFIHNNLFPPHWRPACTYHPFTEIHHHHHYNPPAAHSVPSYTPPSYHAPAGSGHSPDLSYNPLVGSYNSPAGSYYPPARSYYPPAGSYYAPAGSYYPPSPPSYYPPQKSYSWVDSSLGRAMPLMAVRGGRDVDGQPIYVGRAHHERDLIPGKIIPGRRCCSVSYDGKEHAKVTFQVICDTRAEWVPGYGGMVHPDAVEGGKAESGETLYIGRVLHFGSQTVGKIHPSHGSCYIPFDGKEIAFKNYETLISRNY